MSPAETPVYANWDDFVKEAEVPDYVLKISNDDEIRFTNPTGVGLLRIAEGTRKGDLELILLGLAGDQFPAMKKLVGGAGHAALPSLIETLMDHFKLYQPVEMEAPSGRIHTLSKPTEIAARLREGWTFKGERDASRG